MQPDVALVKKLATQLRAWQAEVARCMTEATASDSATVRHFIRQSMVCAVGCTVRVSVEASTHRVSSSGLYVVVPRTQMLQVATPEEEVLKRFLEHLEREQWAARARCVKQES